MSWDTSKYEPARIFTNGNRTIFVYFCKSSCSGIAFVNNNKNIEFPELVTLRSLTLGGYKEVLK